MAMTTEADLRNFKTDQMLNALTMRERWLVHHAAVAGYVLGAESEAGDRKVDVPPDGQIIRRVVESCQTLPDLFPVLSGSVGAVAVKVVEQIDEAPPRYSLVRAVAELCRCEETFADAEIEGLFEDGVFVLVGDAVRLAEVTE